MNDSQFKAFKELVQEANEGAKIEDLINSQIGGSYKFEREGNVINVAPNPLKPGGDLNDQSFKIFTNTNSYCNYQDNYSGQRKDCITFLREYNGWSFNEAGKHLVEYAGLGQRLNLIVDDNSYTYTKPIKRELTPVVNASKGEKTYRDRTKLINFAAQNIEKASYLLEDRGLSLDILKKYKVGYVADGTGTDKKYKYIFPVDFDYVIVRSDSKEKKGRYQNWGSGKPFNFKYLEDASLTDKFIFVVEGYIDALTIEMLEYKAIAINSADNADIFLRWVRKNKKNLADKVLIIAGDKDAAGKTMNAKIKKELANLNIQFVTYIIPYEGDFNQWLIADKSGIEQELRELLDKIDKGEYVSEEETEIIPEDAPVEFGDSVFEKDNCYLKRVKDGSKIIANFVIEPLELIESDKLSELKAVLHTNTGTTLQRKFILEEFNATAKFKKALNSIDLSYTGKDEDLEYIKAKLSRKPFERKKGVNSTGFHFINNKWMFVGGDKTLDENLNEVNDILMLESYKELDTSLLEVEPITQEELLKITQPLFKFNNLKKVATILGYVSGLFLKEKLWQSSIKYNHLLVIGEAGSGKSQTVENIITPLLGIKTSAVGAAKCTPFSTMKTASSSNTVPLIIEEYKPNQIGVQRVKDISNLLRDVYDHHRGQRGKADQSIEYYDLCSPVIIVGEMGIDETAIKERSLQVIFSKLDIEDPSRRKFFKILKDNQDLLKRLGRSLLNASFEMNSKELKELHEACLNTVSSNITAPRVKNSIANSMLGIALLNRVYKDLNLNIKELTGFSNKSILEAINAAAFEDLLDSNNNSKTVVDITLEALSRMADAGKLVEDVDYSVIKGEELALYINRFYDRFNSYRNESKLEDEYLTRSQFATQLRRTAYFTDYRTAKLYEDTSKKVKKNYKCYVLNIQQLRKKGLELEALVGYEDAIEGLEEVASDKEGIPFD